MVQREAAWRPGSEKYGVITQPQRQFEKCTLPEKAKIENKVRGCSKDKLEATYQRFWRKGIAYEMGKGWEDQEEVQTSQPFPSARAEEEQHLACSIIQLQYCHKRGWCSQCSASCHECSLTFAALTKFQPTTRLTLCVYATHCTTH